MYIFSGIDSVEDYDTLPEFILSPDAQLGNCEWNYAKDLVGMLDNDTNQIIYGKFRYNGFCNVLDCVVKNGIKTENMTNVNSFIKYRYKNYKTEKDRNIFIDLDGSSEDKLYFKSSLDLNNYVEFINEYNSFISRMIQQGIEKSLNIYKQIRFNADVIESVQNVLDNIPEVVFTSEDLYLAMLHEFGTKNILTDVYLELTKSDHAFIYSAYRQNSQLFNSFQEIWKIVEAVMSAFENTFNFIFQPYTNLVTYLYINEGLIRLYSHIWQAEYDNTAISIDAESYVRECILRNTLSSFDDRALTAISYYLIGTGAETGHYRFVRNRIKQYIENEKQGKPHLSVKFSPKQAKNSHVPNNVEEHEENDQPTLKKIQALIGMHELKNDIFELSSLVNLNRMRTEKGIPTVPVSLHLVFVGNPGTGKTTVARLLAQLYKEMGVLTKGQLVEVDRSGLVAGYVGQTALKTQEKIQEALGGILFIDEAYTLIKDGNDFGQEAVDTILKAMEDNRDDFVVIVAGYPELMANFINSNPGLKSRFNKFFVFEDYNSEELLQIFLSMCDEYSFSLNENALKIVNEKIRLMVEMKNENFANARDIRNLFEKIVMNQAVRINSMNDPSKQDMMLITEEDIQQL